MAYSDFTHRPTLAMTLLKRTGINLVTVFILCLLAGFSEFQGGGASEQDSSPALVVMLQQESQPAL